MEGVVAANGVNLKHNGLMEKKMPVEATSLSSGSDIEEASSGEYSKGMSNRKRKQSKADEVKANKSRKKKGVKKRDLCRRGSGDDEWQCDKTEKKQRSSVKKRAKKEVGTGDDERLCDEKEKKQRSSMKKRSKKEVVDDENEWEEELRVFSFMKATSRRRNKTSETDYLCFLGNETEFSASCSRSESELSDSHLNNGNYNDCRTMKRNLKSDLGELAICHQCFKGGRRYLFICISCEERLYCLPCIKKWYPNLSKDDVIEKCPFCRGTCNCCTCLHSRGLIETTKRKLSNYERFRHLRYLIGSMLPFLKMFYEAQDQEIETEAKVQGIATSEVVYI